MDMDEKVLTHKILDPRTFKGSFNIWLHFDHLASVMFKDCKTKRKVTYNIHVPKNSVRLTVPPFNESQVCRSLMLTNSNSRELR